LHGYRVLHRLQVAPKHLALSQLGCIGFGQARTPECGVQARAAQEAAAAAAAAAEAEAPVHEENAWGIEVVPADGEASGGGSIGAGSGGVSAAAGARTGPGEPAEGLEYSMPVRRMVLALSGPCRLEPLAPQDDLQRSLPTSIILASHYFPALPDEKRCPVSCSSPSPAACLLKAQVWPLQQHCLTLSGSAHGTACVRRREWMQRSCVRGRWRRARAMSRSS